MAISTINEKLASIEYEDVFHPGIPISADGIGSGDKKQLLLEYPGIVWIISLFGNKRRSLLLGVY